MQNRILLTALAAFLSVQNPANSPAASGQLTESREQSANAMQPPELVMDLIGIRRGMIVGELGAGRGRVTVHLAARVGDQGKVYANDIDPAAIEYLKERCRRQGISNVEVITGLVDDARFPKNSLDLVFMAYVFHHVDKPIPLLQSMLPSLKPGGFVAMAEPKPENTEKSARMLTRERVGQEAKEAGYQLDAVIEDRLKGDNIFILRPIVADAPESQDRQNVRPALFKYRARIGGTHTHGSETQGTQS